jgi:hypothetical protein
MALSAKSSAGESVTKFMKDFGYCEDESQAKPVPAREEFLHSWQTRLKLLEVTKDQREGCNSEEDD